MRYYLLLAEVAILALAASCSIAELEVAETVPAQQREITITATSGEPDTRTVRESDGSVLWSPGDQISLFYGSGTNGGSCFTAQNTEAAKTVNFTGTIGVITGGNNVAVEDTYFWATYPYNATASCDGNSITTVLPSAQVAAADTFADDLFPSMGRSQGLNISFYNICGGIKFTVSEEGIKSVTLKANSGEQIVGTITAAFDGGVPVVTNISDGSDTITLTAPAGETFEVGKAYFFVMVPTVFQTGFTMTFSKGYAQAERVITSKATIKRSVFGTMNTPDAGLEWEMLYVPIPDPNFSAYMIQHFDTNGNGVLDFDEAEAVTEIDVCTDNIVSVQGIEYCPNLQSLVCRGSDATWNATDQKWDGTGKLMSLDVSANMELSTLICSINQLTSLDIRANTTLSTLNCSINNLTSIDVSRNTALQELYCSNNKLTVLDVNANTSLRVLECFFNRLTSIDVSVNTELTVLYCHSNRFTNIDVYNNTELQTLSCGRNQLTSLDVSANTALIYLYCDDNQLTSLDISANTALQVLDCSGNQLTSLDVSANTELWRLACHDSQLTHLDIHANIHLTDLYCYSNQLTKLDVSSNTVLTDLRCYGNQLTRLDVSSNTALTNLRCYSNQLISLDISKNVELRYLDCSPMNDAYGNNKLDYLYVTDGQSIPGITTNRNNNYIPATTAIIAAPEDGGIESTADESLDE